MSTDAQQDAREQARHKASVMIAFAEGKTVRERHRSFPGSAWKNYDPAEDTPLWNWETYEYEVKPEERKPRTGHMWGHPESEELHCSHGHSSYDAARLAGWVIVPVVEFLPETETES